MGSFSSASTAVPFALLLFFFTASACVFHPVVGIRNDSQGDDGDLSLFALLGLLGSSAAAAAADAADDTAGDAAAEVCTGTQDYTQSFALPAVDPATAGFGFTITGPAGGTRFGKTVASGGDFNGDGIGDVAIGAHQYGGTRGRVYVIFGRSGTSGDIPTVGLSTTDGIAIDAEAAGDGLGYYTDSIRFAGDVNGDGFDDVLIGSPSGNANLGAAWLVFGSASPGNVDLTSGTLTAAQGVEFYQAGMYYSGAGVAGPGDINGDGIDDLIIGSYYGPSGDRGSGHVIYGQNGGFGGAALNLNTITGGTTGFVFEGQSSGHYTGKVVGGVGDVNGDGVRDFIVGSDQVGAGAGIVVYGVNGTRGNLDLNATGGIQPADGFQVNGSVNPWAVSLGGNNGGDFNGDGVPDFAMSSNTYNGLTGRTAVLFGNVGNLTLGTPSAAQGFLLNGSGNEQSGRVFSLSGDVNGDGRDDLLVSAHVADNNALTNSGSAYLIFGQTGIPNTGAALSAYADGVQGIRVDGGAGSGRLGHGLDIGDVNGDNCADILIGEPRNGDGNVYVIYGGTAR